jgi:antibiotic biosynthesis monooxygenase (ABM) superfamily enzyme
LIVVKQAKYLFIVRMDVEPDKEKQLNEWYNNMHIPALLKVPGVLSGRRYTAMQGTPKYTAIYEFDRRARDVTSSEAWKKAVEMTPRPKDVVTRNVSRELHKLIYPEA